jgi:hypothetical protein
MKSSFDFISSTTTEVVVQMDFAENYTCLNVSEIQSAYWNPVMVTLHPVVAYFRNPNDDDLQ